MAVCRAMPPRRSSSPAAAWMPRSEEHTSELQSQSNLVCRLLLEKKKNFLGLSVNLVKINGLVNITIIDKLLESIVLYNIHQKLSPLLCIHVQISDRKTKKVDRS